jgi:hypothetical protein
MFPELCAVLGQGEDGAPARDQFVVVRDALPTSTDFVMLHYLSQYLKAPGGRVCLISMQHTMAHVTFLARKMNVALPTLQQSGHFVFVDGLAAVLDDLTDAAAAARGDCWAQVVRASDTFASAQGNAADADAASVVKAHQPLCVIIDGLSELCMQRDDMARALWAIQQVQLRLGPLQVRKQLQVLAARAC